MTKKPSLLYQDDVDAFLKAFVAREKNTANALNDVRKDMRDAFDAIVKEGLAPQRTTDGTDAHPALHPIALAKRVIQKRGLVHNAEELAKITEIIEKTYPRDEVTGYYAKQCMPVMVGLAHMQATSPHNKMPISLVEGDFSNMGGCNVSAIGRKGTDKLIHRICGLLEQSFADYAKAHGQKVGVVAAQAETHGIRAGGDEVRLIVYGLKPEQVQEVLDTRVHPQINLLAAEFGVHTTKHAKKGKLPGFGAAFAAVDLTKETDTARIRELLDSGIEERKQRDGLLRMGVTDNEGIKRYMQEIYEPYLKEQKLDKAGFEEKINGRKRMVESLAADAATLWKTMTADGSPYPAQYHGVQANPRAFFDAYSQKNAASVTAKLADIAFTAVKTNIPFEHESVVDQGEAPESIRLRKALKALGFNDIASADRALFAWDANVRRYELQRPKNMNPGSERSRTLRLAIDLMQQFDALDPSARCKAPHLLVEDAQTFLSRHQDKGGMKVVQFELGNISGLNTVNPDLADAVLRETGKYIQDGLLKHNAGLGTHMMDYLYHEGGGKFKVLLPADYPEKNVKAVADYINTQLNTHIRTKPISDFVALTYARPRFEKKTAPQIDAEIIAAAKDEPLSKPKLEAVRNRLEIMGSYLEKPVVLMSDIPHPKDNDKSLTFKYYTANVAMDAVTDPKNHTIDANKISDALGEITAKAEIAFNKPHAGIIKTG